MCVYDKLPNTSWADAPFCTHTDSIWQLFLLLFCRTWNCYYSLNLSHRWIIIFQYVLFFIEVTISSVKQLYVLIRHAYIYIFLTECLKKYACFVLNVLISTLVIWFFQYHFPFPLWITLSYLPHISWWYLSGLF